MLDCGCFPSLHSVQHKISGTSEKEVREGKNQHKKGQGHQGSDTIPAPTMSEDYEDDLDANVEFENSDPEPKPKVAAKKKPGMFF